MNTLTHLVIVSFKLLRFDLTLYVSNIEESLVNSICWWFSANFNICMSMNCYVQWINFMGKKCLFNADHRLGSLKSKGYTSVLQNTYYGVYNLWVSGIVIQQTLDISKVDKLLGNGSFWRFSEWGTTLLASGWMYTHIQSFLIIFSTNEIYSMTCCINIYLLKINWTRKDKTTNVHLIKQHFISVINHKLIFSTCL